MIVTWIIISNPMFRDCREVKHCEDGSNNSVNKLLTATAALLNQHKEKQDKEKERFHDEKDFEERKIAWPADKDAYELGEVIGKPQVFGYGERKLLTYRGSLAIVLDHI